jgi:uncharacterized glyoxalase superfamily protein PhnB
MRYRDLADAMGWLEQAFGFEKQIAVADTSGEVIYGQMTYGNGLLMLGAVRDTDLDKLMRQPDELGGIETQSCYIVIDDADAHYARAREAGAEIVLELKSDGLGRRGYSCRDPQGHIWNFGTYDPGRGLGSAEPAPVAAKPASPPMPSRRSRLMIAGAALVCAIGAVVGWTFRGEIKADFQERLARIANERAASETARAYGELVKVRSEKRESDQELAAERARRAAAEADAQKAAQALAEAQKAHATAEVNAQTTASALAEAEKARAAAEAEAAALREALQRGQEAAAAVEAKRISEEKLAAGVEQRQSPPAQPATSAPETGDIPSPPQDIETSATGAPAATPSSAAPLKLPAADGDSTDKSTKNPKSMKTSSAGTSTRVRRTVRQSSRINPTYVVELGDVPWPYSTWYRR